VETDQQVPNTPFQKKAVNVFFSPDPVHDLVVAMQVSKRYGIIYLVGRYDFHSPVRPGGRRLGYMQHISGETISVTAEHQATSGIIGVARKDQVLSINVDQNMTIPYILSTLNNTEVAFNMASLADMPRAGDLYRQQYHHLIQSGQFGEAAKVAANSPRGILHTPETIAAIQGCACTARPPLALSFNHSFFCWKMSTSTSLNHSNLATATSSAYTT